MANQRGSLLGLALPATDGSAWGKTAVLRYLIVFAIYLVLYRSSNIFHTTDLRSTPWNPEAGVAVAAGVLLGWPATPVIFAASLVGGIFWGPPFPLFWKIVSAGLHALLFAGTATYFRSVFLNLREPTTRGILLFLCYACAVTAVSAAGRLIVAVLAYDIAASYLYSYAVALSVGNLIGIATVVPIPFIFDSIEKLRRYLAEWGPVQWLSAASVFAVSVVVFGLDEIDQFKFFYLVFLPVIALAVKDGFPGAALGVLLSDVVMIVILLWRDFEPSTATELQVLMLSLSATGLILGAAVTERHRMSEQLEASHLRLQESQLALLHATRVSLASEMAAALAHELNQPLSAIRNFIRSVRRKLDRQKLDRHQLRSDIDAAVWQVDSAAGLIKTTRNFLSRGDVRMALLDVKQLIQTAGALVELELRNSRVKLSVDIPDGLPKIAGNASQLQQVVLNLVRNAKEAILEKRSKSGEVSIAVSAVSRPGYLEVSVTDTGPGVSEPLKAMLFKPLTSSKSEGLGLGLSLCSTIVAAHGGELWHDESHRPGARFAFTIPAASKARPVA